MNVFIHDANGTKIAEAQSEGIIIRSARDAADITRELLAQGLNKLILHERNVSPEFWQASHGLAAVILQEFASKAVAVAFVGSENIAAAIQKSGFGNKAFVSESVEAAKERFAAR